MSIVNNLIPRLVPNFISNGYFAIKKFFTGAAPVEEVATDFVKDTAKNTVVEVGKMAVTGAITSAIPGANFVAQAATTVAANGLNAAIDGNNMGRALVKGGINAVNIALVGPLCAIPLNMATDCLVDKALNIHNGVGFKTAYHNYCIAPDYEALKYCKNFGNTESTRIVDEDLNMSFMLVSRAAAAA